MIYNKIFKDRIYNYLIEQITFEDFVYYMKDDIKFLKFLIKKRNLKDVIERIVLQDKYEFSDKINLYFSIEKYFVKNNRKKFKATIEKIYEFLVDNLPKWFDGYNIDYMYKLFVKLNLDISDEKSVQLYQDEISKHFRYDSYPPRFLTSFNWPEKNNIPLCFKEMKETIINDLITIKYIFYSPEDPKDIIEIIQRDYQ